MDPYPIAAETACGDNPPAAASEPKPQFNAPAQVIQDSTKYFARFETSCGTIVVKLLPETAPQTVNSFVFLAEQGYFDGQIFHRLDTSIDVVQGGDPTGTGTGGPGYSIPDENLPAEGGANYPAGTVAMANAGPGTGGSQFFITVAPTTWLNFKHTIFGEVADQPSRDVVDAIAGVATGSQDRPVDNVVITSVTVDRG